MPVMSMTGFARFEGETLEASFVWELRSVNGKGLEVRIRLPQGLESIEADVRRTVSARLARGNVQVSLAMRRTEEGTGSFSINAAMLTEILRLSNQLVSEGHATPPSADGILGLKGVIELAENETLPELAAQRARDALNGLGPALDRLLQSRADEGALLRAILDERLNEIAALSARAEDDPARRPEAIRAKLARQVGELMGAAVAPLDEARLHQEAAILATKADIREELDRLAAHVSAARELLATGGAIGRRLDFLSQEFNRESNTLCSKSNATSLTAVGVELKVVVDQFREQVQNIE